MTIYRSPRWLATAVSLAVVANLAAPLVLVGRAVREAWTLSLIVAVLLTLVFVHRAARNLEAIGDGHARFTPGQSVGWLLIPLVNIWMAHQVLTALWRDSQPVPGRVRHGNGDFSVLAANTWLAIVPLRLMANGFAAELGLARIGPTVVVALWLGQGIAFIVLVLGIAARQREQWLDLERRHAVPQPSASALR